MDDADRRKALKFIQDAVGNAGPDFEQRLAALGITPQQLASQMDALDPDIPDDIPDEA